MAATEAHTCFEEGIRCIHVAVCGRVVITGPQLAVVRPDLPLHEPIFWIYELLIKSQQTIKMIFLLPENADEHTIPAHQLPYQ